MHCAWPWFLLRALLRESLGCWREQGGHGLREPEVVAGRSRGGGAGPVGVGEGGGDAGGCTRGCGSGAGGWRPGTGGCVCSRGPSLPWLLGPGPWSSSRPLLRATDKNSSICVLKPVFVFSLRFYLSGRERGGDRDSKREYKREGEGEAGPH